MINRYIITLAVMHLCALRCTMPAKNPRLTITLAPALALQLRKLSELTGSSQSALIGDLLHGSEPVFDRMIKLLEAAQIAKDSMKGRIVEDMDKAQSDLEGLLGIALDHLDHATLSLFDESEAVQRRARRGPAVRGGIAPAAASPTPISNRGVRLDPKATKVIAQSHLKASPKPKKTGAKTRGVKT